MIDRLAHTLVFAIALMGTGCRGVPLELRESPAVERGRTVVCASDPATVTRFTTQGLTVSGPNTIYLR
jgi:hypothetical protein